MGITTTKLLTFADFEKLPDEVCRRHELRHGELVEVADPKLKHSLRQYHLFNFSNPPAGPAPS
jgi:Uma2 family endonuclease